MKHTISYILAVAVLLLPANVLLASPVSVTKAEKAARSFLGSAGITKSAGSDLRLIYAGPSTKAASEAPYYVFNAGENCFVVIAGDDGMMPVLGYSFESSFDPKDIPDGLSLLLDRYSMNASDLVKGKKAPASGASVRWSEILNPTKASSTASTVVDLKTARWSQEAPFWRECPVYVHDEINDTCVTGCGPTALAIIMRHYKKPSSGVGTIPAYTTSTLSISVGATALGTAYDWDNMPEDYSAISPTDAQKNAVARLMADLGHAVQADYQPSHDSYTGTGATNVSIIPNMVKYMKFRNTAIMRDRGDYTTQKWVSMLKSELDADHPVMYQGQSVSGGHFYVVDGYDSEDRMHFNWGWGGSSNGFFYVADTEFSSQDGAYFDLVPEESESDLKYSLAHTTYEVSPNYFYPIWTDTSYVEAGKDVTIYTTVLNTGAGPFDGQLKLGVRHSNNSVTYVSEEKSVNLTTNTLCSRDFTINLASIEEGDEIVAYYKADGESVWYPVDGGNTSLPLQYSIADVVSLKYIASGSNRYFMLYARGYSVPFTISGYSTVYYVRPQGGDVYFNNPSGSAVLTFNNGHETYPLTLTF